jgi:hypothetical protein
MFSAATFKANASAKPFYRRAFFVHLCTVGQFVAGLTTFEADQKSEKNLFTKIENFPKLHFFDFVHRFVASVVARDISICLLHARLCSVEIFLRRRVGTDVS